MHELFISEFKDKKFFEISNCKDVKIKIENSKYDKWTDLQKKIRKDKPIEYYEYKAEICNDLSEIDLKNIKSLSINNYQIFKLEQNIYQTLKKINFEQVSFFDSVLNIDFPINIYKVKTINCNGKTLKGEIDFEKFTQLEYIHFFDFNNSIKFKGKAFNVTHITFWHFKPKSKSIEDIVNTFPNLKEIIINHTNIDNIDNLDELKNLKKLEISKASNLKNINVVKKMSSIESVRFESCNKIENIDLFNLSEEQKYRFKKYKILEW